MSRWIKPRKVVGAELPEDLHTAVKRASLDRGVTVQDAYQQALEAWLDLVQVGETTQHPPQMQVVTPAVGDYTPITKEIDSLQTIVLGLPAWAIRPIIAVARQMREMLKGGEIIDIAAASSSELERAAAFKRIEESAEIEEKAHGLDRESTKKKRGNHSDGASSPGRAQAGNP